MPDTHYTGGSVCSRLQLDCEKKGLCPAGNTTLIFHTSNLQFPHFIRKLEREGGRGRGEREGRGEEGPYLASTLYTRIYRV